MLRILAGNEPFISDSRILQEGYQHFSRYIEVFCTDNNINILHECLIYAVIFQQCQNNTNWPQHTKKT